MTNKEIYEYLKISKKAFYNYIKLGMPKDIKLAQEWLKERQGFTDRGSGSITIGGREYTKEDLIDLRGQIMDLTAKEKQSKIDLQEFELQKRRGELVPRSELTKTLQAILEPLAKMLEQLPNKISNLVNPDDPATAYKVLEKEIQNIFAEIQKQKNNNVR
jgi:hypothetical protein